MGFVCKAEHPGIVGHFYDGAQVRADAVVGGVIHQHSHSIRMLFNGLFHLFPLHAQRDAKALVHLGVHIHRHRAAQYQCVQHTAVHIAGQNDLIAALAGGKHHALHTAGGAAHHEERVGSAKGICGQLLCFPDDRYRVAEIIQRLHAVHIHAHALLAQKGGQLRVAAASLVAGHIKGHHPHFAELFQRFIDGRTVLVQPEPCSVLTHVFPPSLIPMQTKKRKYRTKSADLRFEKHLNAPPKTPGRNTRVQRPLRMIQKDGIMRVYIAILLLLLFIDRFTSLHTDCAISWL